MISAVLVVADSQRQRANRLVEYCRQLDGTELVVLQGDDGTRAPYPHCNTNAFHQAAATMKGKPFLWIEADCVPRRAGWLKAVSKDYDRVAKPILAPYVDGSPFDIASGICVYPPDAHWLFPKRYPHHAWDGWMERHLQPLIGRTRLIQHSYGNYDPLGNARPHRFPRDQKILREEAVLFHRDRYQDLIPREGTPTMLHSGDLGDLIAALPIARAIGPVRLIVCEDKQSPLGQRGRESLKGKRFEAILPLLESQPYIEAVSWEDDVPDTADFDTRSFRTLKRRTGENLAQWQARFLDTEISLEPWLAVPGVIPNEKIIVNRSSRYHGRFFPWRQIVQRYRKDLLFLGLPQEHMAFQQLVQTSIPFQLTTTLLDAAKLIGGCRRFIGNQSCLFWIAAAMGVPLIQESWVHDLNSIVRRENAIYTPSDADQRTLIYRLNKTGRVAAWGGTTFHSAVR